MTKAVWACLKFIFSVNYLIIAYIASPERELLTIKAGGCGGGSFLIVKGPVYEFFGKVACLPVCFIYTGHCILLKFLKKCQRQMTANWVQDPYCSMFILLYYICMSENRQHRLLFMPVWAACEATSNININLPNGPF